MVITCDSCNTILETGLTMKPRDPEAAIGVLQRAWLAAHRKARRSHWD
jgi:hypothetical protein